MEPQGHQPHHRVKRSDRTSELSRAAKRRRLEWIVSGAVSGDLGRSWKVISALSCTVSPLYRLVRRVDPHGPTLECLHQLRAGSSADLARARAGLKKCGHRFPGILSLAMLCSSFIVSVLTKSEMWQRERRLTIK